MLKNFILILVFLCELFVIEAIQSPIGCQGTNLALTCPINNQISVVGAFYGRNLSISNSTCVRCSNTTTCSSCSSKNAVTVVKNLCDGKRTCSINVQSPSPFADPCSKINKFLQVTYDCIGIKVNVPINGQLIGCYSNTKAKPALKVAYSYNNSLSTNTMCNNFCLARKQTFATTINNNLCYCGSSTISLNTTSNCKCKCGGNDLEFCGCSDSVRMFKVINKTSIEKIDSEYLGCYTDNLISDLSATKIYSTQMTIEKCMLYCSSNSLPYAGLQEGKYCFCGKTFGKYGKSTDQSYCSTFCNGNSKQYCGNTLANSIFSVKKNSLSLDCPAFRVLINTNITCLLKIVSNGKNLTVKLDFNDTDIRSIALKDQTLKIYKTFKASGNFPIRASIPSELLDIDPIINVIPCNKPAPSIKGLRRLSSPLPIRRRSKFELYGINTCIYSYSDRNLWKLNLVNASNGKTISNVSLSKNPTSGKTVLTVNSFALKYGVYEFIYYIYQLRAPISSAFAKTYVKIIPSGIAVFGLKSGTTNTQIGSEQSLKLMPANYSRDLDSFISPYTLNYKFFCRVLYPNKSYPAFRLSFSNFNLSLFEIQNDLDLPLNFNDTCFTTRDDFEVTDKSLLINPGSLVSNLKNLTYEFGIRTDYMGEIFFQTIRVKLLPYKPPSVSLECRFSENCLPLDPDWRSINPNTQLVIDGFCLSGCNPIKDKITYKFSIFYTFATEESLSKATWIEFIDSGSEKYIFGQNTNGLLITSPLFDLYQSVYFWRVVYTINLLNKETSGSSSLIFRKNQLPSKGSCLIDYDEGIELETYFTISCANWTDIDGDIEKYEYYVTYLNNFNPIALNYNSNGTLTIQLPLGPDYDSFNIYVLVHVIDDGNGKTIYNITKPVKVFPNKNLTSGILKDILNLEPSSEFLQELNDQDIQKTAKNIIGLSNSLNIQYSTFNTNSNQDLSTKNINISDLASNDEEIEKSKRASVREFFLNTISNISVSSLSDIKVISSVLASVTQSTNEISQKSADLAFSKCNDLVSTLDSMKSDLTIEDIIQAGSDIISSLSNILTGVNSPLNSKGTFLLNDISSISDTNSNFSADDLIVQQKNKLIELKNQSENVFYTLASFINIHLTENQTQNIKSYNVEINYKKRKLSTHNESIEMSNLNIKMPSLCELISKGNITYCEKKLVNQQVKVLNSALIGLNGDNETNTGGSKSISLSFYDDDDGSELMIEDQTNPIEFWIQKDSSLNGYKLYNLTYSNDLFVTNTFIKSTSNSSIHIQIKPINSNKKLGYLIIVKLDGLPVLTNKEEVYDYWKLYCPSDLVVELNDYYYLFFLNMNETQNYTGKIGYSIRELTFYELNQYCNLSQTVYNETKAPFYTHDSTKNKTSYFSDDIWIRVYTSGCYYYDTINNKWSSYGTEILIDSNSTHTHCLTYHLTEFAGGFVVVPSEINFQSVFANASFLQNPTIYVTCIVLISLYVLLAIFMFYRDRQDRLKVGITFLPNKVNNSYNYFYEIIVFTGNRNNSGTDSNVNENKIIENILRDWIKVEFVLTGDEDSSEIYLLKDSKRKVLRTGGIDSFIISTNGCLGDLNSIKLRHDNSGIRNMSDWFLKFIIVHDLQTREKFYFICDKWFSLNKDEGMIERTLGICGQKQKTEFKYLLSKQAKQSMTDNHLWFSIFTRSLNNSFSRLDRLTCCFVLLLMSMLMNILYYDVDKSKTDQGALKIGPFILTIQQLSIGVISNLIIFPPSFLLIQLFRRSKNRVSRFKTIKNMINEFNSKNTHKINEEKPIRNSSKKKKIPLKFPWWFKIIAYFLSFSFAFISLFFIIVKGISFGDEKVNKWLTSILVSFFSSVLLIQPVQVVLLAFLFVSIFKSSNDKNDVENDADDDGKSINKENSWKQKKKNADFKTIDINEFDSMAQSEKERLEKEANHQKEMKKIFRDIIFYSVFLCVLFISSYSFSNPNSFNYNNALKNLLIDEKFNEITTTNEIYEWISKCLLPVFKFDLNQCESCSKIHLRDYSSVLLGVITLRQNRVKKNSCKLPKSFKDVLDHCEGDLSVLNEEKNDYDLNWSNEINNQTNGNEIKINSETIKNLNNAFKYTQSSEINSLPLAGEYSTYFGSGYVFKITGDLNEANNDLKNLNMLNWIDRQTRSLIIEFSLYNPNINMFSYNSILFEILPTGNLIKSFTFNTFSINDLNRGFNSFELLFNVFYIIVIIIFTIVTVIKIMKMKFAFLKSFWSYIDISLIAFSITTIVMYFYRLYEAKKIIDLIKNYLAKNDFLNVQYLSYLNYILILSSAFCIVFGTLKFIKLIRFNKHIAIFMLVFSNSISQLLSFGLIFFIIWLAFVQLLYLLLNETREFSSFLVSMETCFQIMLGKFQVNGIIQSQKILAILSFIIYNFVIVITLINLFLSILNDNLQIVKNNYERDRGDFSVYEYVKSIFFQLIPSNHNEKRDLENKKYIDAIDGFKLKINQLTDLIDSKISWKNKYRI